MKYMLIFSIVFSMLSFNDAEKIVFKSVDSKTKITATDQWKEFEKKKGVEIFITRTNNATGIPVTLVVSKDAGLKSGIDLNTYSARKIFLQTAALKTEPLSTSETIINGRKYKIFEYEYDNKDLLKMKSLVYHTLIGTTGYQLVTSTDSESFDQNKPFYIKILNSLEVSN
jgi:hypothetical protein